MRLERPRRADAVRNFAHILEAAAEILEDKPQASMQTIAEASGLGRATLYRHFASREALLRAIRAQAYDESEKALAAAQPDEGSALEALDRVVAALVDVGARYRVLGGEPQRDSGLRAQEERLRKPLLALMERGQAEGTLRRDMPSTWMVGTLGALLLFAQRAVTEGYIEPSAVVGHVTRTFLSGTGTPGT